MDVVRGATTRNTMGGINTILKISRLAEMQVCFLKNFEKIKKIPNSFDDFSNGAIYILKGKV